MSAPLILVVDDDPDLRETLVDLLDMAGYATISAEHGRAALDLLQQTSELPTAILLDFMMPVMNGRAFVSEMRKDPRLAALPIVLFTAHSDHDRIAQEVQATASLSKPLKLEQLLSVVGSVTHRPDWRLLPSKPSEW